MMEARWWLVTRLEAGCESANQVGHEEDEERGSSSRGGSAPPQGGAVDGAFIILISQL